MGMLDHLKNVMSLVSNKIKVSQGLIPNHKLCSRGDIFVQRPFQSAFLFDDDRRSTCVTRKTRTSA